MLNRKVLVLNQNYEPLSICSAKRALVMVFLGKAEVVEEAGTVHTVSRAFPLPSVVRLWMYVHKPRNDIPLTKRNILRRDGHRCQYCGTTQGPMTVDHVIPKMEATADERGTVLQRYVALVVRGKRFFPLSKR